MSKEIEVYANTVGEAIRRGLDDLGIETDDAIIEVLQHPKSGFFGFGASKAKVKITKKEEIKQETAKEQVKMPAKEQIKEQAKSPAKEQVKKEQVKKEQIEKTPQAKEDNKEEAIKSEPKALKSQITDDEKSAKEFIDGLLEKMGINATCDVLEDGKDVSLNIVGEGLGNVIGRRGDTLDSIQYITNLIVKNNTSNDIKVSVDCENYREKRVQTLERLAVKMGNKVLKYKKNMTLEPMNPYERRMIHEALQEFEGVYTYSTGKEPNRRVVIGFGEGRKEKINK